MTLQEIVEDYLDDQWQWQQLSEKQEYEEEQYRQPDHLSMINEYEWKEWLGI